MASTPHNLYGKLGLNARVAIAAIGNPVRLQILFVLRGIALLQEAAKRLP